MQCVVSAYMKIMHTRKKKLTFWDSIRLCIIPNITHNANINEILPRIRCKVKVCYASGMHAQIRGKGFTKCAFLGAPFTKLARSWPHGLVSYLSPVSEEKLHLQ